MSNELQNAAANTSQGLPVGGLPELQNEQPAVPAQPTQQQEAPAHPTTPPAPANPADVLLNDEQQPEPNADTSQSFTYEPTGDAGLDYALNYVGKLGYTDRHPAVLAAMNGDFSIIKAELATKGVAGYSDVIALAETAYAKFQKEDQAKAAELTQFAAQAAGSAENWADVRAWAAKEATPQEKAAINQALAAGGIAAQGVISRLVELYSAKHTLPKPEQPVATAASAGGNNSGEIVTAAVYSQRLNELQAKYGYGVEHRPEYHQLQEARLRAMRAGR